MHRAVNRLAHPDVPLRLVFQGNAKPCILPGGATIDDLRGEAIRLHNLDSQKQFRFVLGGVKLRAGAAISETPLANTEDLDVVVLPQAAAVTGGAWRYEAVAAHGRSSLNKAAARAPRPTPKRQAAAVTGGAWRYEAVAAHGRSGLNEAAARAPHPNPKRPVGTAERAAITRRIGLRPVSAVVQFPTFATHPNGQ